ncbi:hypothetical protein AVEN_95389-1 [Araneus ventricosus]|uniref:Uncharacterized protein n=1 Tax=Araneus ventricosus TaxID=182803 RepID=A0A4Y2CGF7_ARAVE|nr:hypothetical protein AVEN_95389-1 [Araneus ventricosus]
MTGIWQLLPKETDGVTASDTCLVSSSATGTTVSRQTVQTLEGTFIHMLAGSSDVPLFTATHRRPRLWPGVESMHCGHTATVVLCDVFRRVQVYLQSDSRRTFI